MQESFPKNSAIHADNTSPNSTQTIVLNARFKVNSRPDQKTKCLGALGAPFHMSKMWETSATIAF
jgi:hypothetical protein